NATAHGNLGYLLACRGDHDAAVDEAEDAIALDPARSAPWAHLGMSRLATGDVDEGLVALTRAVRLDPANHFAWDAMRRAFLARARGLNPADEEARYHRALLDALVGATDEARKELAPLSSSHGPWSAEATALLGQLEPPQPLRD